MTPNMIWLVGCNGMLGTELSRLFEAKKLPFVGTDRELSILESGALADFARDKGLRWIINCAAYTAVDKAESDAETCAALNVRGPENLARLAQELGASMLHLSTDYVFSGTASSPYREDDPVGPTGVYGRTKAEGEARVREACERSVLLRTAWLYGKHGPNFVHTMLRLMKERESIGVVADQVGSPTWAYNLAEAIYAIVTAPQPRYGIYHYTNSGICSWYDFAREIHRLGRAAGLLESDCEIRPLTTDQYPTAAVRPAYSVLSKDKIAADYGVALLPWQVGLEKFITGLSDILHTTYTN